MDIHHPEETHENEKELEKMYIATIDFEVSGAAILPNAGTDTAELGYKDEHITIKLNINGKLHDGQDDFYEVAPTCKEEMETKHLLMALPKQTLIDDEIEDKAKEEHSGTEKDVTDLEDEGLDAEKKADGKHSEASDAEHVECGCVNGECEAGK